MLNLTTKTHYSNLTFQALKKDCDTCQACELSATRTHVVFGSGPSDAAIMLIGEAPGHDEDIQAKPFVGRSGKLLTTFFESVGIDRETEVFITNTVKCRPPENRDPLPVERAACQDYLIRQIQLVQPKLLILVGNPSLKNILGKDKAITRCRGTWFKLPVDYMDDDLSVMPMFHPAYLLRNPSDKKGGPKWLTGQDFKEIKTTYNRFNLTATKVYS